MRLKAHGCAMEEGNELPDCHAMGRVARHHGRIASFPRARHDGALTGVSGPLHTDHAGVRGHAPRPDRPRRGAAERHGAYTPRGIQARQRTRCRIAGYVPPGPDRRRQRQPRFLQDDMGLIHLTDGRKPVSMIGINDNTPMLMACRARYGSGAAGMEKTYLFTIWTGGPV